MGKSNVVLTITRAVDQFITPDQMVQLKSLVNLTRPGQIDPTEDGYRIAEGRAYGNHCDRMGITALDDVGSLGQFTVEICGASDG